MKLRKAIFMVLGPIFMAGIPACDDNPTANGGADAYASEGTYTEPLDITAMLPYDGQVSKGGTSYYRVTAVPPGAAYTITLIREEGLAYQTVPNSVGLGSIACGWDNITPGDTIDCAMLASAGGVLDFSVLGDDEVGGSYILSVTGGGAVNEGSIDDPVVVSSFPFSGMALIQSYYMLTGLTPAGSYSIEFTEASNMVALFIFPDETYLLKPDICSSSYGSGVPCNVIADGSGQIYLLTNAQDIYGIFYTIAVNPAAVANEGSVTQPVDIGGLLPYSGMVHRGSSWYIINGLISGSPYTITLSNATDNVGLYLYGPGWFESLRREDCQVWWASGGGDPIEGVSVADENGDIRIEVRGFETSDGATFDLNNAAGGIPNEGYGTTPIDITGIMPWSGTVYNGTSYYKITGMSPATDYTVTIHELTGNIALFVYDDNAYQNTICYSSQPGSVDEICVVQTATGEFYMRVVPAYNIFGLTFSINVTQ